MKGLNFISPAESSSASHCDSNVHAWAEQLSQFATEGLLNASAPLAARKALSKLLRRSGSFNL